MHPVSCSTYSSGITTSSKQFILVSLCGEINKVRMLKEREKSEIRMKQRRRKDR
jgi:hypothetical protein